MQSSSSTSASTTTGRAEEGSDDGARREIVDRSTLTLLEHVNINVPSQEYAVPFYYKVLGMGMDPRKAANLRPDAPKKTLWANCGASQFHLPYGETPQRIPGQIGLRYDSLAGLKRRLEEEKELVERCVKDAKIVDDGTVRLVDRYDNVLLCRTGGNPVSDPKLRQPVITKDQTEEWGDVATEYGRDDAADTDCKGIDFVEFMCPVGTAEKIAIFYESVLDATASVVAVEEDGDSTKVAIVAFGNIDRAGRADQSLLFRETPDDEIPPYDGHHVAMYVGETSADFEKAFKNCQLAKVVWVNPRFSDKASTLEGARKWKQFRFKNVVDMNTGEPVFELEHEMRSVEHEAWPTTE